MRLFRSGLMALSAAALLGGSTAQAQQMWLAARNKNVVDQRQMASAQFAGDLHEGSEWTSGEAVYSGYASCDDGCVADCESCPTCQPMCPDYRGPEPCFDCIKPWGGLVIGAEATFLKPHDNFGVGMDVNINGNTGSESAEFGYELAPRVWLGYVQGDGLGFRVSYWQFDHTTTAPGEGMLVVPGADSVSVNYDTYVFDAEFTDTRNIADKWYMMITGGVRYVHYGLNVAFLADGAPTTFNGDFAGVVDDFTGEGLTSSIKLRRMVRPWASLFVMGRGSVVMGDSRSYVNNELDGLVMIRRTDVLRYMWEGQIGGEVHVDTVGGSRLFARGALETQSWDGFGQGDAVGFSGFTAAVGMER